jgi:ELWxxDGT repeat protein
MIQAQQVLKDINPGGGNSISNNAYLTVMNNALYFNALNSDQGRELWKTDGSTAGTVLVKDIKTGTSGADPILLKAVGNKLFFVADDGVHGTELWVSDGSTNGTKLANDNNPGALGSTNKFLQKFGDKLLFTCNPYNGAGEELWVSDGSTGGTYQVKDINQGSSSSPINFHEWGGNMYFSADASPFGYELWRSDGTFGGTNMVKDIYPGFGYGGPDYQIATFNNKLYFFGADPVNGKELWSSDGTESGTSLAQDITPGASNTASAFRNLTVMNGALFFSSSAPGLTGAYLWKTNGTNGGAAVISSVVEPIESGLDPNNFTVFNNKLYFRGRTQAKGEELWVTDGTAAGTQMVKDIMPGTGSSSVSTNFMLTPLGNYLYFRANDNVHGTELWRTDGTEAGTTMVADLYPGQQGVNPQNLLSWNGAIYFSGQHPNQGLELWKYDPALTEADAQLASSPRVQVYPNPSGDHLYLESALPPGDLHIHNVLGQTSIVETVEVSVGKYKVNTTGLAPGIYQFFGSLNKAQVTGSFVVHK